VAPSLTDRLRAIRLLLLDVDGVLTDGAVIYSESGSEIKSFNVKDGMGIRMLQRSAIPVGIVTGRRSEALRHRCRDLGIDLLMDGTADKGAALASILSETGLSAGDIGFMGDDLPDLPLMAKVGTALAVADAVPQVLAAAHLVTDRPGGKGAVREAAEAILQAQGKWDALHRAYLT
jgi:3-deoxy-D-manno-octulosonate 8-phosphate phosphatase (KDO 8-P phosphatase)